MQNTFEHRETWLHAVAKGLRPLFEMTGYPIPLNIRLTCGFPSRRGVAPKRRALGQAWASTSSKDGHYEIMISPVVDEPVKVAAILAHELVHVAVGIEYGHRGPFKTVAMKIGLEGRMPSTIAGEAFKRFLAPILETVGPYPHAELLVGQTSGPKKQTARLIKCACPVCGFPARTTRQWLEDIGPPVCPRHGDMVEASAAPARRSRI
jgi:hypothetical protein